MTKARTLADNFAADINGITAGTGITGGGTSGTVTVTNSMATEIDAKGDLVVGTGADTFSRLAVASTAGYLLSVDSAEATGLKWAAPAAGGLTLISTSIPSGATAVDFTSISSDYKMLMVTWIGLYASTNNTNFLFRLNNNSGSVYNYREIEFNGNTPTNYFGAETQLPCMVRTTSTSEVDTASGYIMIFNANSTTLDKYCEGVTSYKRADTSAIVIRRHSTHYNDTNAITQINFYRAETAGTISVTSGGSIQLWGLK